MSYPRKLHVLIVEDDSSVIDAYKEHFRSLRKTFPLVEPVYARSFADAKGCVDGQSIFHIVILDLNLPMETQGTPVEGFVPGEDLLELLAQRDDAPVPVVLVVSGKLNLPHSTRGIKDRLANDFFHGDLLTKASVDEYQEIARGLQKALAYVDVGIHIRDSGRDVFPILSPREDDLLRRCVLANASTLGVDIRWWSAELGPTISRPSFSRGPTKVLMGKFLLDDGMEVSIPTFFKFESAGNALFATRDVGILSQKLRHVKVFGIQKSRRRSLIVTQSVTNHGTPVPLSSYLAGSPEAVSSHLPRLISEVVAQLKLLGGESADNVLIGSLMWEHLDAQAIEKTWRAYRERLPNEPPTDSPIGLLASIRSSAEKCWTNRRSCVHGDLNATNVAIDTTQEGHPEAYIFDPAGMKADFALRDLAMLEVTTIVFNAAEAHEGLLDACRPFFSGEFLPKVSPPPISSALTRNILSLISAIRENVVTEGERTVYALLVFDAVLVQLSGLGIQPSHNKVRSPAAACRMAEWIAEWVPAVARGIRLDATQLALGDGATGEVAIVLPLGHG